MKYNRRKRKHITNQLKIFLHLPLVPTVGQEMLNTQLFHRYTHTQSQMECSAADSYQYNTLQHLMRFFSLSPWNGLLSRRNSVSCISSTIHITSQHTYFALQYTTIYITLHTARERYISAYKYVFLFCCFYFCFSFSGSSAQNCFFAPSSSCFIGEVFFVLIYLNVEWHLLTLKQRRYAHASSLQSRPSASQ